MNANKLIELLNLEPLPQEGGFFIQSYRAKLTLNELPRGKRPAGTAIYYLITPESYSKIHSITSDEVFHFYLGDSVEMLQISPTGEFKTVRIGNDLEAGETVQHLVPAGDWQGCRLSPGGEWALLGCTVVPGFDFADFSMVKKKALVALNPALSSVVDRYL